MNNIHMITLGAAVAIALGSATAQARYDEHDAQRDCEDKLSQDSRFEGWRGVQVDRNGSQNYTVTGKVRMQGERDPSFVCRIRHKEVVSWHINSRHGHNNDHDGSDAGTAAAVGAGVLGLAILAAASSDSDNSDNNRSHYQSRDNYQSGNGSAFSDMHYLKKECKHNIRHHLRQDHGQIEYLDLNQVHLSGRRLRGDGEVGFRNGYDRRRHLSLTCEFDRNGRIYDGTYHYN